jgi:hypothetical protein
MKRYSRGWVFMHTDNGNIRAEFNVYKNDKDSTFIKMGQKWVRVIYRAQYGEWEITEPVEE